MDRDALYQKMREGLAVPPPAATRRDIRLPRTPHKAMAVIGMRRAGKTTFLRQCMADRLAAGAPRESLLYLHLEDDRLAGMRTADLSWLLEEYYRLFPLLRDKRRVGLFLDEIQLVPEWEKFIRRIMDSEAVDVFLSGSSARMLSREVATSMRGRAMEVLVHPFSFREALRHAGAEPEGPRAAATKAQRSELNHRLKAWLRTGGFPEAQGLDPVDAAPLLRGYVDSVLLRDILERHGVGQAVALRWMARQLLGNAACPFNVSKFHQDLKSQGLAVAKDTVHALLSHLEDSFLVRTVWLDTASERARMLNPRKAYPVDTGFIALFEGAQRPNTGHALESAVLVELERRGCLVGYVKNKEGTEVDFHAKAPSGDTFLIQVCADTGGEGTLAREVRALLEAAPRYPHAEKCLITLDPVAPPVPDGVRWIAAADWFLGSTGAP